MRQKSHGPAAVTLAKGLSARASKADVSTLDDDQPIALQHGRGGNADLPRRAAVRFNRPEFYLKIDGLSGARPALRGKKPV
ncbi:hypothetical protein ABI_28470 [Asticcacaulis biprosthecium C19]|uniref:Uncharacterized protein n=1 Tax=Asticcacaulis biprosthecium C19 TaxID=715226 RepID=F4QMJ0_9CAUL|nr:hypothetical protein [Asticcacaulis biprosthecium]EGF91431.1 hypothetical protein ABI_28470 [Asticcacaulis biprosthecium C19]